MSSFENGQIVFNICEKKLVFLVFKKYLEESPESEYKFCEVETCVNGEKYIIPENFLTDEISYTEVYDNVF